MGGNPDVFSSTPSGPRPLPYQGPSLLLQRSSLSQVVQQDYAGPTPLKERNVGIPAQDFWNGFKDYLEKIPLNPKTVRLRMLYAKRCVSVLTAGDATELLQIKSAETRMTAMKAIVALSKYLGCYDRWMEIKRRYNLKWSSPDNALAIQRFIDDYNEQSFDNMCAWIKKSLRLSPPSIANYIRLLVATGLRPSEGIECLRLLQQGAPGYYDESRLCLLHFKFPVFWRRTKRAFISFVSPEMLKSDRILTDIPQSYNSVRLHLCRLGLGCNLQYCRKVFSSHLRHCGINSEIVEVLSGRCSRSVFQRFYYSPQADYRAKVLQAVHELNEKIAEP